MKFMIVFMLEFLEKKITRENERYTSMSLLLQIFNWSLLLVPVCCSVTAFPDVKYGKRIHVLPIDDTVEGITG